MGRGIRAGVVVLILILLGATGGCATMAQEAGRAKLYEPLGDKGVVIAEFYGFEAYKADIADGPLVRLDGHRMIVALSPGKYALDKVVNERTEGRMVHKTWLTVNRSFEVQAGKVTNLGLILFVADKQHEKFVPVNIDNTAEVRRYLQAAYPALASLKESDFTLAPGNYMSKDKLTDARRLIAYTRNLRESFNPRDLSPSVVIGPAGLIGEYVIKGNTITDVNVFDTGTLATPASVCHVGDRHFIAMSDGKLFLLDKGRLTPVTAPAGMAPIALTKLTSGGMVVIDERMVAFYTSDEGKHWFRFSGAQRRAEESEGKIRVVDDADGFYVYTTSEPPQRIIYSKAAPLGFSVIPPPPAETLDGLVPSKSGLFAQRSFKVFRDGEIYFRPTGSTAWEARSLPTDICTFDGADRLDPAVRASCGSYRSDDGGKSWRYVERK